MSCADDSGMRAAMRAVVKSGVTQGRNSPARSSPSSRPFVTTFDLGKA